MIIVEKLIHALSFDSINVQVQWQMLRFGMGVWKKKESEAQCQICWTDTGNVFNIANVYYLYYKHKEEETLSLTIHI